MTKTQGRMDPIDAVLAVAFIFAMALSFLIANLFCGSKKLDELKHELQATANADRRTLVSELQALAADIDFQQGQRAADRQLLLGEIDLLALKMQQLQRPAGPPPDEPDLPPLLPPAPPTPPPASEAKRPPCPTPPNPPRRKPGCS